LFDAAVDILLLATSWARLYAAIVSAFDHRQGGLLEFDDTDLPATVIAAHVAQPKGSLRRIPLKNEPRPVLRLAQAVELRERLDCKADGAQERRLLRGSTAEFAGY
jgi:hypothetical protein